MARKTVSPQTQTQPKPTPLTEQPSQLDISRERTIANEYESLLTNNIVADKAAATVAHNHSTPSLTMSPADIPLIAERVKQRDNA